MKVDDRFAISDQMDEAIVSAGGAADPVPSEDLQHASGDAVPAAMKAGQHKRVGMPTLMAARWQEQMAIVYPLFQKPLTVKDTSLLRKLYRIWGEASLELLDCALNDWLEFVHRVRFGGYLGTFPTSPNIAFLLAHQKTVPELLLRVKEKTERKKQKEAIVPIRNKEPSAPVIKPAPIRLGFTPQQLSVIYEGGGDEYRKFMAAIVEKYGEECIINGRYVGGDQTLCEIEVSFTSQQTDQTIDPTTLKKEPTHGLDNH